jgi:hypothetical protein
MYGDRDVDAWIALVRMSDHVLRRDLQLPQQAALPGPLSVACGTTPVV